MSLLFRPIDKSRLLIDGHLVIDNSTLEHFTTCPRKFLQYAVLERELNATKSALSFGTAIHLALEHRYAKCGPSAPDVGVRHEMDLIIEKHFRENPPPPDDHRTLSFARAVLDCYDITYGDEPFEVLQHGGERLVEKPFALELGTVQNLPVIWTGKIDVAIKWADGRISPMDHKTTSMFGPGYYDEFINSQAQLGYCWALQKSFPEKVVSSYMINTLVCRKPSVSGKGKGLEMQRQVLHLDVDRLEEWRMNVLHLVEDILHCDFRKYYPMHFKACTLKFGRCEFLDVCSVHENARASVLYSPQYRDVTWSPIITPKDGEDEN